jgi:hypothetical protein
VSLTLRVCVCACRVQTLAENLSYQSLARAQSVSTLYFAYGMSWVTCFVQPLSMHDYVYYAKRVLLDWNRRVKCQGGRCTCVSRDSAVSPYPLPSAHRHPTSPDATATANPFVTASGDGPVWHDSIDDHRVKYVNTLFWTLFAHLNSSLLFFGYAVTMRWGPNAPYFLMNEEAGVTEENFNRMLVYAAAQSLTAILQLIAFRTLFRWKFGEGVDMFRGAYVVLRMYRWCILALFFTAAMLTPLVFVRHSRLANQL